METANPISLGVIIVLPFLTLGAAFASPPAPTTQPAATIHEPAGANADAALKAPATSPATAPAATPQAAKAPATAPAVDPKAVAEQHQKEMLEHWREARRQQRISMRDRWANAPIVQTFKAGALVRLSVCDGYLSGDAADIGAIAAARVAVEGSKAIWTVSSPNRQVFMGQAAIANSYVSVTRFDFDAKDSDYWQTRVMVSGANLTLFAQNLLGNATIFQLPGTLIVRVSEAQDVGQPPAVLFEAKSSSLRQLRAENPVEFRTYVLPLLTKFAAPTLMQPGSADVYGAFSQIPADPRMLHEIELLAPALDSDDPDEREAASAKLGRLGSPGVLAALRFDDGNLSYEQKIRLRAFVAIHRRRAYVPPAVAVRDLNFLIDCLEYEDPAVKAAAKSALETQTRHDIAFDASLPPAELGKAADALRKQLLVTPPAAPGANTTHDPANAAVVSRAESTVHRRQRRNTAL